MIGEILSSLHRRFPTRLALGHRIRSIYSLLMKQHGCKMKRRSRILRCFQALKGLETLLHADFVEHTNCNGAINSKKIIILCGDGHQPQYLCQAKTSLSGGKLFGNTMCWQLLEAFGWKLASAI